MNYRKLITKPKVQKLRLEGDKENSVPLESIHNL